MAANHDPIAKFLRWLNDARRLGIANYEAAALATIGRDTRPSVRFVLLKGVDGRGFVFFTDSRSRKGRELRRDPRAALAIYWQPHGRQVRVEGRVAEVTPAEVDSYWFARARQSQLAAAASYQSARLHSHTQLRAQFARVAARWQGLNVPRPPVWTGFRLRPHAIEFWTQRENRLHQRELYLRQRGGWRRELLQP